MSKRKLFTWKELSKFRHVSNVHVAYEGKVYDVSSFISRHPGGVEQILSGAGRDITQIFKSYHKSDTFERVLSKYYVGDLVDNEHPVFVKESEFYKLVRQRVGKHLKTHNLDPKIDYGMFSLYFFILLLYLLSLYLFIFYHDNLLYSFVFTIIRAFLSTMVGGTLHHDASHFAITHKPWMWKFCKFVASCILGMSSCVWHYRHVIGHHSYTNIEGVDPDIDTGPEESIGIYRIKGDRPWAGRFIYQHLYMPILYSLETTVMKISDFQSILSLTIGNIRLNPLDAIQRFEFWFSKLGYFIIHFFIPLHFMPLTHVILFLAIFELMFSFMFVQMAQLNHVTNETSWPTPDKTTKQVQQDWAELQVAATQDYCTDSWFWTLLTGALNHQTAHHLFPGFIQSHYYWITPIVKQTCADMNIKYNSVDSVRQVLGLHYKFLKKMGKNRLVS